jgi:hypothetical protein
VSITAKPQMADLKSPVSNLKSQTNPNTSNPKQHRTRPAPSPADDRASGPLATSPSGRGCPKDSEGLVAAGRVGQTARPQASRTVGCPTPGSSAGRRTLPPLAAKTELTKNIIRRREAHLKIRPREAHVDPAKPTSAMGHSISNRCSVWNLRKPFPALEWSRAPRTTRHPDRRVPIPVEGELNFTAVAEESQGQWPILLRNVATHLDTLPGCG